MPKQQAQFVVLFDNLFKKKKPKYETQKFSMRVVRARLLCHLFEGI